MKLNYLTFLLLFILISCSESEIKESGKLNLNEYKTIIFNQGQKNYGVKFANLFINFVKKADKNNVDLFSENNTLAYLKMNSHISRELNENNLIEFAEISVNSLTKPQLKVVKMIENANLNNSNYNDFKEELLSISLYVDNFINENQKETLFNMISMIYYTTLEIEKETLSGDGSKSWPPYLSTLWTIALAEPSPLGEAVAGAITIGYTIYYVADRAECISSYVSCVQNGGTNCGSCLNYCVVQGDWNC